MADTVPQKIDAILNEQYPLQNLAADSDLLEIIGQLRARHIDLETNQNNDHNFFDFAPVGCLILNEQGLILDVNPIGAEMVQQKSELLLNHSLTGDLDSNSQPIFARHLAAVFTSGQHESCELILKSQDGATTCLQLRSIAHQRGNMLGCYTILTDITERKQLEEALHKNKSLFRLLTDNASDLICLHEPDGRYLYLSPSCKRLLGYQPKELVGQNPYELFHAEDIKRIRTESHNKARQGQEITSITYRIRHKSGTYIWFETNTQPMFNSNGQVIRLITTSRDVTKRRQIELALEEQRTSLARRVEERTTELTQTNQQLLKSQQTTEALYKFGRLSMTCQDTSTLLGTTTSYIAQILPADRVLIYLLDLQTRQVTHFAKGGPGSAITPQVTFTELWGGLTGWVIRQGQPALSADQPPDLRESEPVRQRRVALKAGATLVVPLEYQEQIIGTLTAVKAENEDPFISDDLEMVQSLASQLAVALRNISLTDSLRTRTRELSTANAELARAARLKDEFLANMSHELRTPLNAILGMSEVLQMETFGNLNDKQRNSLKHIEEGGRHLLSLINDILDLSKIEAGRLELDLETVPVEDVCQACLRFVQQQALNKQVKLVFEIDDNIKTLEVDERRLKQILVNLLTNAVKFTPSGGQVGLEVTRVVDESAVRFTVWDTGVGISKEDLQTLFQPFVQLDSSLAREQEGTGLGLALVYRLAELHGGSVTVESQVNQGSHFTVSIPWRSIAVYRGKTILSQAEVISVPIAAADSVGLPRPIILLAEDNKTNITLVQDLLQTLDYQVIVAQNGFEAVERARADHPSLILMDIQMPGMDGLEAIQRIRADEDEVLARMPIIALTALAMTGDKERCLEAGANDYLSKPVSMRRLLDLIEEYLGKEPY